VNSLAILSLLLSAALSGDGAIALCDGDPPVLINQDKTPYTFQLKCGRKMEKQTIKGGATKTLKGKSGCKLIVGKNAPKRLHEEMTCTIKGGVLTCELI